MSFRRQDRLRTDLARRLDTVAAAEAERDGATLKAQGAELGNASNWMITELVEWVLDADGLLLELLHEAPEAFTPEFREEAAAMIRNAAIELRGSGVAAEERAQVRFLSAARKSIGSPRDAKEELLRGFRDRSGSVDDASTFTVWFATNREPLLRNGIVIGYTGSRSDATHLGRCEVTIPKSHQIGSVGSPWWKRVFIGDDRLKVRELRSLEESSFWSAMAHSPHCERAPGDPVVFLHGYRVSFEAAAIGAAQMGADLQIQGPMTFFSWPSNATLLGYMKDEASIQASEKEIAAFITRLIDESHPRRVHIIAHSMGNRALVATIERIADAAQRHGRSLGQVMLAAPDVDVKVFRDHAHHYPRGAARTTLYVSEGDLAVRASRLLHGAARVGFAPPVTVFPGIDTVDVTGVDLTLLGHGYVAETEAVVTDMHSLIAHGHPPAQRGGLKAFPSGPDPTHWKLEVS